MTSFSVMLLVNNHSHLMTYHFSPTSEISSVVFHATILQHFGTRQATPASVCRRRKNALKGMIRDNWIYCKNEER